MKMNGSIYSLIDPRDNKIKYIGQTRFKISKRYSEHLRNSTYAATNNYKVYRWINDLKSENLLPRIELIENVDFADLDKREMYWISIYSKELNNMTVGGCGVNTIDKRIFTEEHKQKIGNSCRAEKHYNYGKKAHNIRPIYQFKIDDNVPLNEYKSITEASKNTNVNSNAIVFCLRGRRNSAGEFIWIYKEEYDNDNSIINDKIKMAKNNPSNIRKSIIIKKINIENNDIIETYNSIKEAARLNNTSDAALIFTCRKSLTHIYRGHKWLIETNEL